MKGVSSVIETVLMAAAVITFLVYLMGAFGTFTEMVVGERTRTALNIDAQKVINAVLLARREVGAGDSKFYIDLADLPSEIEIKNGHVIARTRTISVNKTIFNLDSYVSFQGVIVNTQGKRPFIRSSGDVVTLGVE
ncbi:MAG: hypothetical protein GOU98_03565 [Candidatus Altiarchaeota archaeon]|nr:hypothetical protein [Candidatus Altiarchaeota archaeon]